MPLAPSKSASAVLRRLPEPVRRRGVLAGGQADGPVCASGDGGARRFPARLHDNLAHDIALMLGLRLDILFRY